MNGEGSWRWKVTAVCIVMFDLALVALAFSLLAGCEPAPDLSPIEGQERIVEMVWAQGFGRTDRAPGIEWMRGAGLNCGNGDAFISPSGECRWGSYVHGDDFVRVSVAARFVVPHEFAHVMHWREGRPDFDHSHPDFAPGGIVERLEVAIGDWR